MAAEEHGPFARSRKKVQMETVEMMLAAGKDIQDETTAAVKKATAESETAAKKSDHCCKSKLVQVVKYLTLRLLPDDERLKGRSSPELLSSLCSAPIVSPCTTVTSNCSAFAAEINTLADTSADSTARILLHTETQRYVTLAHTLAQSRARLRAPSPDPPDLLPTVRPCSRG